MPKNALLLYLHIPFCDSKCHYCAFNSYVDRFSLRDRYMQAIVRQLRNDLRLYDIAEKSIETLFIGGGTPSTVVPELYEPFFTTIRKYLHDDAEITAEANPNSADESWLEGMKDLGVNRISFGVQSFFDDKLRFLGRAHRAKEAIAAIETARKVGFGHINCDLIYATALDTPARIEKELQVAADMPIDHLSAYELTIEEGTPFARNPEAKRESLAQAELIANTVQSWGWQHYEVSNFGRYVCRHNMGYWRYRPYLGIGAGAVGRIGSKRLYPLSDPQAYIDDPCHKEIEPLDEEAMLQERILLGLRCIAGVEADILDDIMRKRCDLLVKEGKLRFGNGRYLNENFWLSDEIALFIVG